MGHIKLKHFCTVKEMVTRQQMKPTEWEKNLPAINYNRIYRELNNWTPKNQ
jgi:hypothetical protein